MTERRMAEVVSKPGGLYDVRINWCYFQQFGLLERYLFSDTATQLANLQRVRQPVVEDETFRRADDLRNSSEPSERGTVQNPVSVALRWRPHVARILDVMKPIVSHL